MQCAAIVQSVAIVVCVVCFHASLEDGAVNYCGARMCEYTDSHTFCRYPPGPEPSCAGYIDARLPAEERTRVLARLNRRRAEVARGRRPLPPAADMLKLRWVEELAREAQRWADQCQPPSAPEYYDGCRDLYSITVGQCVASVVGEAPGLRAETMVDLWHMQSRHYAGLVTSYMLPENTTNYYGDFAQMVYSRAYMVGCGRSRFMTPWHGRLRSVERLVCNFAPRGPMPRHPIWSPGIPASACPPRSASDADIPELCAYHYTMDETYDEDNIMSLEEHVLLNTILEIEKNATLNYIGHIDEIYLTKLAVATIENPVITVPSHRIDSVQEGDAENSQIPPKPYESVNNSYYKIQDNAIKDSNLELNLTNKSLKKKVHIVGRPKAFHIDDLNDSKMKTNNYDKTQETTTVERDINYDDYDDVESLEESTSAIPATTVITETHNKYYNTEPTLRENEESSSNSANIVIQTLPHAAFSQNVSFTSTTETFGRFLNDIISNLTLPDILNESAIDTNILDDYLSDPETVRQLQEALDQMERKTASSSSTSGKVRRELRNLQHLDDQKMYNLKEAVKVEDLSESERNKSIDRGPMLSMVLKYMPYLKPYENSIVGRSNANSGRVMSPSFILFIVLYF